MRSRRQQKERQDQETEQARWIWRSTAGALFMDANNVGIFLSAPEAPSPERIGQVSAFCTISQDGKELCRSLNQIFQAQIGATVLLPQDFSPRLLWPLAQGRYEVHWHLSDRRYASRHAIGLSDKGLSL
ncbi:MAG: hypothetical protein WA860_10535 [Acidimicrobiales bacterium]